VHGAGNCPHAVCNSTRISDRRRQSSLSSDGRLEVILFPVNPRQ
jgi:hypothetical protein